MTDLSKRNKANKRKGAKFETDILANITTHLPATRLVKTGRNDEGDIAIDILDDSVIVLECKDEARINLSGYLAEAKVEAINYQAHRVHSQNYPENAFPAAVVKRRNSSTEKSYTVMELGDFIELIVRLRDR